MTEKVNKIARYIQLWQNFTFVISVTRHLDFSIFLGCHLLFRMMTLFSTDDGL